MKKFKKYAAIAGVILLVGLYALTLVFAIIDHSQAQSMLKASVYATVFIPVMLYLFLFLTRLLKGKDDSAEEEIRRIKEKNRTEKSQKRNNI